jgi:cytochrome c553
MRRTLAFLALVALALPASAAKQTYSYEDYFEHHEGTKTCLDCHGADGRIDWTGLGYDADPLAAALTPSH